MSTSPASRIRTSRQHCAIDFWSKCCEHVVTTFWTEVDSTALPRAQNTGRGRRFFIKVTRKFTVTQQLELSHTHVWPEFVQSVLEWIRWLLQSRAVATSSNYYRLGHWITFSGWFRHTLEEKIYRMNSQVVCFWYHRQKWLSTRSLHVSIHLKNQFQWKGHSIFSKHWLISSPNFGWRKVLCII